MKADAIVVAYKSEDVIYTCVSSLRSDPSIRSIIVVNNSPGDSTQNAISDVDEVVYLEPGSNVGFGRAVNFARRLVREPFVVLANPDTLQRGETITAVLSFFADHPRAGIVAPRMVGRGNERYLNSQHATSLVRMLFQSLGWPSALAMTRSKKDHERAHLSAYVIGSFVVCRVAALEEIDWFDESIFLFGEDYDLCQRMHQAGREVWFATVGEVVHLSGHSWRQLNDEGRALFRSARYRGLRRRGKTRAEIYRRTVWLLDLYRRWRRSGTSRTLS
jgi:GT2 family glycosyltransferase